MFECEGGAGMTFLQPYWLLVVFPVAVIMMLYPAATRLLNILRILLVSLVILSLAGLGVVLPSREGSVIVVADRSASMPGDSVSRQNEMVDIIEGSISGGGRLGVVSFAERAGVDRSPQRGAFSGFITEVGSDGSNLSAGIDLALSLIPPGSPGRVLVITDDGVTGSDPVRQAARAVDRNVAIDYSIMDRAGGGDLAVYRIRGPENLSLGEAFMINAWIYSPFGQEVNYILQRGGRVIAAGERQVGAGLTRFTFRDSAEQSGTIVYRFRINSQNPDPVPENNTARLLAGVSGQKDVLLVSQNMPSGLAEMLRGSGINITQMAAGEADWSLEGLSSYSSLIIENLPANMIGGAGMENIAMWVEQAGAGLMLTGGRNSYGPGGYYKSPLERVLPVSMELRTEHRKLAIAIAVALDRSGSMAAQAGFSGRTKMDLANIATAEVMDMLSPFDSLGVIAVDSSPHVIVEMDTMERNINYRNKVLQIDSMGGGIFVYTGLARAAEMIKDAEPVTKHIILFADAADSEEPGRYVELLAECGSAGITVSVIGLGKPTDSDAGFLRDVAARGNGRIFFTENASELPRLFAQDTFVVARSAFINEPVGVDTTAGLISLTGRSYDIDVPIGGYNLCYLKDGAVPGAVSVDEYESPIIAGMRAGTGRTVAYTGQADGEFTGEIAGRGYYGELLSGLARWSAGEGQGGEEYIVTERMAEGVLEITMHLDPDRDSLPFVEVPSVSVLKGRPGEMPEAFKRQMEFVDADTVRAEIDIAGSDTYLPSVVVDGDVRVTCSPVTQPYSPEFRPVDVGVGRRVSMARLAELTGGGERVDLAGIWGDLPRMRQVVDVSPWLVYAGIFVLLLEVLERRTGMLSAIRFRLGSDKAGVRDVSRKRRRAKAFKKPPAETDEDKKKAAAEERGVGDKKQKGGKKEQDEKDKGKGMVDAFSRARRSAQARTNKKDN
jgi:hypothetical protein